jgi:hypothetical protein
MADALFAVYYRRAAQLASAMRLCRDDLSAYASAAALLAVHSAISYSDAVLIGLIGKRPRGEDHRQAGIVLKHACARARIDQRGISHLQALLSVKTAISYGDQLIDNERIEALCNTAARFQTWADRVLAKLEGRQS